MEKNLNVKKVMKKVAIRIWNFLSPGVNHPMTCAPSEWLVLQFVAMVATPTQIVEEIWRLARRALRMRFPGLERPLGSCFHPFVADILDVVYYYKKETQRALTAVARAAGEVATTRRSLWRLEGGRVVEDGTKHIMLCPEFLGTLARAVRSGLAPEISGLVPSFFVEGWDEWLAAAKTADAEIRTRFAEVLKVLREMEVSPTALEFAEEGTTLAVDERWYDSSHCPNGRGTNEWIHDGRKTEVGSEKLEEPHGYFGGGGRDTSTIEGATYAIDVYSSPKVNGKPARVVIWPGCDPERLAAALAPIVFGGGANREFARAMGDVALAREWIRANFVRAENGPEGPGQVRLVGTLPDGRERSDGFRVGYGSGHVCVWNYCPGSDFGPAAKLVSKHGLATVADLLPPATKEFVAALSDPSSAKKWIATGWAVEKDGEMIKFTNITGNSVSVRGGGSAYGSGAGVSDLLAVVWAHDWEFIQSMAN